MLFNAQEQDDHGDRGEDRGGEQILPLDEVKAIKDVDAHGDGLEHIAGNRDQGGGEHDETGGQNHGADHEHKQRCPRPGGFPCSRPLFLLNKKERSVRGTGMISRSEIRKSWI